MQFLGSGLPADSAPLGSPDLNMGGCHAGLVALWGIPARVTALEAAVADQHETLDILNADVVYVEERVNGLAAYIERTRMSANRANRWQNTQIPHVGNVD